MESDANGCCISCGYTYCEVLDKCIRLWEEECINPHRRLNKLDEFNLTELGVFIAGVFASIGALLVVLQKSKCQKINCCCLKCERDVKAILEEERLEKTGHTGSTPRLSLDENINENSVNP